MLLRQCSWLYLPSGAGTPSDDRVLVQIEIVISYKRAVEDSGSMWRSTFAMNRRFEADAANVRP
jgi:hypothetical protein